VEQGTLPAISTQLAAELETNPLLLNDRQLRMFCLIVKGDVDSELNSNAMRRDWEQVQALAGELGNTDMPAVKYRELRDDAGGETSEQIRDRVVRARQHQLTRYQGEKIFCNAQMSPRQIRKYCNISAECERLLETAMNRLGLSARAHDRILKVSRTIADLEGAESISTTHISEAIQYRSLDRSYWA
jgi:hypothetical protein